MSCSPFVTQSLAADGCPSGVEGGAFWPVGLTARKGRNCTDRPGRRLSLRPSGAGLIGPHECSIARAEKKFRIDESPEQRVARGAVKAPQPLRLRCRQAQSGHLDVLALNTPKCIFKRLLC